MNNGFRANEYKCKLPFFDKNANIKTSKTSLKSIPCYHRFRLKISLWIFKHTKITILSLLGSPF